MSRMPVVSAGLRPGLLTPRPLSTVSVAYARPASVLSCPLSTHCSGGHSEAVIPDLDADSVCSVCMLASELTPGTWWEAYKG